MEQRPLRLGDIVDDYCPRERRVTNHAVVALVDDTVKQTRCTTCDHEHAFKNAREPRRRKKDDASALYSQVLSGLQKTTPSIETDSHMANDIDDETEISAEEEVAHAAALGGMAAAGGCGAAALSISCSSSLAMCVTESCASRAGSLSPPGIFWRPESTCE